MSEETAVQNTDRELWREPPGDYYANSIHVTTSGGVGINVAGTVFVKPLSDWHSIQAELAAIRLAFPEDHSARTEGSIAEGVRELVSRIQLLEAMEVTVESMANERMLAVGAVENDYNKKLGALRELLREIDDQMYLSMPKELAQRITAALGTAERKP